ncbi:hypothetical protein PINS_up016555 [Pythium insidiosum]|nr:hypothetical protein PINS_up016555 [Pythium insidiosum]
MDLLLDLISLHLPYCKSRLHTVSNQSLLLLAHRFEASRCSHFATCLSSSRMSSPRHRHITGGHNRSNEPRAHEQDRAILWTTAPSSRFEELIVEMTYVQSLEGT